jgi:hypothetical protein
MKQKKGGKGKIKSRKERKKTLENMRRKLMRKKETSL